MDYFGHKFLEIFLQRQEKRTYEKYIYQDTNSYPDKLDILPFSEMI